MPNKKSPDQHRQPDRRKCRARLDAGEHVAEDREEQKRGGREQQQVGARAFTAPLADQPPPAAGESKGRMIKRDSQAGTGQEQQCLTGGKFMLQEQRQRQHAERG